MKSFSQYLRNKFNEMDGSGNSTAVDLPNSSPPGSGTPPQTADEDSDAGLQQAINIVLKKYRNELEQFLQKLSTSDSELQQALQGNEQGPIPHTGDNGGDVMVPPMADRS